jgi:hypothetical protein
MYCLGFKMSSRYITQAQEENSILKLFINFQADGFLGQNYSMTRLVMTKNLIMGKKRLVVGMATNNMSNFLLFFGFLRKSTLRITIQSTKIEVRNLLGEL